MEADNEQKTIEEAFSQSWDRVQMLFGSYTGSDVVQWQKSMLMLIADLRKRGYDRRLHAGQSMYTFVLSHSREHGLRYEQARIAFDLNESGAMKIS